MSTSSHETAIEEQVSVTIDNDEILDSGSDCGDSNSAVSDRFRVFAGNGMIRLDEDCSENEIVKKIFLSGMTLAARDTNVVAVHKNLNCDLTRKARFESFKIFSQAVAQKNGGNANIKYAWYGGSRDEISEILFHGFSRCRAPTPNGLCYGVGVHLIPAKFACDGALSSAVDESGLKHILLCRVILGKSEMVAPDSKQSLPSSKDVDTGVDSLIDPRRYVVWSAFMNSHISPVYVISFKAPPPKVIYTRQEMALKPSSPWMSFPTLMSILSKFLAPPKMQQLVQCHNEFRTNKISRPLLIQKVRQIAGDKLLIQVIKSFRTKMAIDKANANANV